LVVTDRAKSRLPHVVFHRCRSQAAETLDEGKRVYASGGRAAALKLFESALSTMEPPPEVRRELLYSCGCCHAAFGDVDNAWMCIRGMCIALRVCGFPLEEREVLTSA